MILKNIKQELADCRAAWAAAPTAQWAHGLHHDRHIEKLTEPIENRIAYILAHKPKPEQALRFCHLRPWLGSVPMEIQEAYAAWEEAYAARKKAYAAWEEAYAARKKAYAAWEEAYAARKKAYASVQKAYASVQKAYAARKKAYAAWEKSAEFQAEHARLFPDCPWDGETFLNGIA